MHETFLLPGHERDVKPKRFNPQVSHIAHTAPLLGQTSGSGCLGYQEDQKQLGFSINYRREA